MENIHTYIGNLAVEKGYITQEQLNECILILDQQEEESEKQIEELLLENSLLSQEQIEQLQTKRKINLKKIEAQAVLEYLKKMKLVDEEKLEKCLEVQKKAVAQKTYIPLQTLLVSHGLLKQETADKILQQVEIQRSIREAVCKDDPRRTGLLGRVLGGYEIKSKIAAGGMGVVYKALQLDLNRTVALKILFEKFASNKQHLKQFFREAKLAGILNHPNLVHIFEMGEEQGFYYYSMELVEGTNFGDYIKEKNILPQEEALKYITQAARGLEHIHSFDVVHRDIKPSNFIIRSDGILKIMDLGLARELSNVQKKRATMGTPYYMSPELIHNPELADQRADIYALGVSFYRILTGDHPIGGNDAREILDNIAKQTPKPISSYVPDISMEIEKVVQKMIEKDPAKRYQNMSQVLGDLDRILIIE